mmetsp:Transcript_25474/g.51121  ORF Transcript_25474/g.51121 Transcript_25474/m.51121 type:complete len:268 (-) Transcript_25474:78-881(-)|eukprot:CAMPEP_0113403118 /NCGR_PEP_ID=MMETSP0013_2-20120614/17647_1 /TAXON_ID=2843 ORGANISM="Skeletonema costatum, Strain 1716" /NCGR_SAMPLE_ID=MMETSP0013_2 /ASSEMBLY_ACC=CAM_ASM_000158 /LENGTH=267 /DNA_ID=CAMNT_0000288555 /DNA_START=105 /DNA_END=908 /DNA_ORIENTATION=- /assembly_acc=CAM_ASM_000158
MKTTSSVLSAAILLSAASAARAASDDQCFDFTPMSSVSTYLGATLDYSVADRICCHNHKFAEYRGYLAAPEVDFFGRLDPLVETVFYDSVCGLPLFIAPRGRTFDDFKKESLKHGWPSFRPEEMISENVIIHDDGRMESVCATHLGHNLPTGGVDRYCIDLVCMAGEPLSAGDERNQILQYIQQEQIINATELNTTSYTSSAEQYSGKTSNATAIIISVAVVGLFLVVVAFVCCEKPGWKRKGDEIQVGSSETSTSIHEDDEENEIY